MNRCFVIQPFDSGIYDERFKDTFKPAIENAGLEAYRIDDDLSVKVPIDDIEQGIKDSVICFAEISTDNPNVWYELGYAFAHGKDVIMVCSEERKSQTFPFDIRHRAIVTYKTGSKSDYERLESTITDKIKALLKTSKTVTTLTDTPVVATEGLKGHEIALLILIAESQFTSDDGVPIYRLQNEMGKAGYRDIATSLAVRGLKRLEMIVTFVDADYNNNEYPSCRLTRQGEDWLLSNQDKLQFRKDDSSPEPEATPDEEDLPF